MPMLCSLCLCYVHFILQDNTSIFCWFSYEFDDNARPKCKCYVVGLVLNLITLQGHFYVKDVHCYFVMLLVQFVDG